MGRENNVKIFVTIPSQNNLCYIICNINSKDDLLIYSNYCRNKIKCEQFLRKIPQAMAAPKWISDEENNPNCLYVVATKDFLESHTFREHCDALNIEMMDPPLNPCPNIYKMCLRYTVEHRLAPQWNKVESYLVEGQDFLSSTGSVNAIKLNIIDIRDNRAEFQVEAVNFKIPFLRLNTLQHASIDSVYVLPSLKKGTVLSKSNEIKEKHLFENYKAMRTYWKNMHNYILPDQEEGLLYYEIKFYYKSKGKWCSSIRSYPETCLTIEGLNISSSANPIFTIDTFEEDLRKRVRELCGQQLNVIREERDLAGISMLPSIDRSSTCDTGYDTQSSSFNNEMPSRKFDFSNIPLCTRKSPLFIRKRFQSPPGINNSLTCKPDYVIDNIATISYDADSATTSKSIINQINEEKSHLKQKKSKPENKALVQELEEEPKKKKYKV